MNKNILITTLGTLGDIHPAIGLGLALQKKGCAVTIATSDTFRERIQKVGLEYLELRPSLADAQKNPNWIVESINPKTGSEFSLKNIMLPFLQDNYDVLAKKISSIDLLINFSFCYASPIVAEKFKKKWVSVVLQPLTFFSVYDPPIVASRPDIYKFWQKSPLWLTRFLLSLIRRKVNRWAEPIQNFREKQGIQRLSKNPLLEGQFSPSLNLAFFSKEFAAPQLDWISSTKCYGFPLFDQDVQSKLSEPIRNFLNRSKDPVVVFTLGSFIVHYAEHFFSLALKVSRQLNIKAILVLGPHDSIRNQITSEDNIMATSYEPYSELFAQAAIVVNQGGIGTVSQCLAAGTPQIVVPFFSDQYDNAYRVFKMGCGEQVLSQNLSESSLSDALLKILKSPLYQQKTTQVASVVKQENALSKAAEDLIHL